MKQLFLILTILLLACPLEMLANQKRPKGLSPESLYRSGQTHYNKKKYEKSIAEFLLVAEEYAEDGSRREKELAIKANKMLWNIYEFIYYDHAKAYEAVLRAQELADNLGIKDPEISFGLGSISQTLSEQGDDLKLSEQAYDYFTKCVDEVLETGNDKDNYLDMAVSNILLLTRDLSRYGDVDALWSRYVGKRNGSGKGENSIYEYNRMFHEIVMLEHAGKYDEAVKTLDAQLDQMERSNDMKRYAAATYLLKSEILEKAHAPCGEVISALEKLLALAKDNNMKDAVLLANKLLWKHYAAGECANKEKELAYRSGYLESKDSILNYRQVATMKEIGASRQISKVKREMDSVRQRYFVTVVVLAAVLTLLIITFIFYRQLRRKNRELSFKNESLYQFAQRDITGTDESVENKKYITSGLSESDARELGRKIEEVFADATEICKEDFSAQRLAAILDTSYPYVSQIINTRFNCNFNTLLNRSRIREACVIMNDPALSKTLTIEGISQKVGFKSRTTFINSFKKTTGMTPSEYLKVAEKRQ